MGHIGMRSTTGREASAELVSALRHCAESLPQPEEVEAFGTFFDRYADAKVVLLGEATHAFRRTGLSRTLTDWRGAKDRELVDMLRTPLLERAIGVIYRPESEFLSHYFEAVLSEQFDAWLWFEQTRAVTPIGSERPVGAPETYPFGL